MEKNWYTELKPNNLLNPYVENYWIIDGMGIDAFQYILPDGCVDIIISFGDSSIHNGYKPNIPYIFGTYTSFVPAPNIGYIKMCGIRFKPTIFKLFTRIPIYEFTNRREDIFSFQSIFDQSFFSHIERSIEIGLSMKAILGNIEQFLINRLPLLPSFDKRIEHAVSLIQIHSGNLSIDKIAAEACLSERQLERRFKAEVGISPKAFSRIIKFQALHNRLNFGEWSSLHELAWDCGYFDNAHLTREYLKLSGTLPSESSPQNVGFVQELKFK